MAATPKLYYVYTSQTEHTAADDSLDDILITGGAPSSVATTPADNMIFSGLAIDPAAGVYFVSALDENVSPNTSYIYEEKFGQPFSTSDGKKVATGLDDDVTSLAVNASDDIVYFASGTGFYEEKFGSNFSGTPTTVQLASFTNLSAAGDGSGNTDQAVGAMAYDQADHSAYFAAPSYKDFPTTTTRKTKPTPTHIASHKSDPFQTPGGSWAFITTKATLTSNYIYKVSGVTAGATANSLSGSVVNLKGTNGQLPFSDGAITGVAVDSKDDTLIITTKAITGTSANHAGIYEYNIGTGAVSTVWDELVTSATSSLTDMTYITIDPATGQYFVSDTDSKTPGIYTGSVAATGVKPTLLYGDPDDSPILYNSNLGLAVDLPPSVSAVAVTAIDGSTSKTTGTVTTADTVTISVTFSEAVVVASTPSLTLNDGGSATYASGSGTSTLVFSYKPASGQNTSTLATTGALTGGTITDQAGTSADLTNLAQSLTGLRVETTPPTLSVTGQTNDVVQDAATPTTLLRSDTITDTNGAGSISKATISIASAKSGDELSITGLSGGTVDSGAITVTGNNTATLTLTGAASVSEYQTLLADVTYQDTGTDTTTSGHPTRTIDWTVDDSALSSNTATTSVTIDRAPTITAGATATFVPGGFNATLDSGLTVTDLDNSSITGAKVTIASGYVSGDKLNFTNQNGITAMQSGDQLTLTGPATVAQYQAALDSVTYAFSPSDGDPTNGGTDTSRTIDWTVDDGVTNSAVATSTLDVEHVAPTVTAGATAHYSEVGPPVALDTGLTVSDPDSNGDLISATVAISSGFLAGDVLAAGSSETGVTASYNSADGVLSLTGSASLANYQAELESVTYASMADDATDGGTDKSRTLTWTVNDGVDSSTPATSTVDITPCYVRGVRILTERGEVAVEALRVGDLAITASGRRRPIVWIGHRRLDISRHRDPAAVRPVRVSAGAFADELPRRDLWLSPGHNVVSDGVLIPISRLLNGRSIRQIDADRIDYFHVELETHDILLAEGFPAESYLDCGNRAAFENSGVFIEAHPDFAPKHWAETCLPLVQQGEAVARTKARLLARLAEQGHRVVCEADAHIVVDGQRIEPTRLSKTEFAFSLPADGRDLVLRSRTFVPAHTIPENYDTRELGVCVVRLLIDGEPMALDADEACGAGWHGAEFDAGGFAQRWTRGAAALAAGARSVRLELAGDGYYWRDCEGGMEAASAERGRG